MERTSRPAGRTGDLGALVVGLGARLRLPALERAHDRRVVLAVFTAVNAFISIAIMAVAALVTRQPFVFPSLGPTAFLLFYGAMTPAASPRNTVLGHLIGVVAGYIALVVTGLTTTPANLVDVSGARVAACAVALGLACGGMAVLNLAHPPAGATTMIVALGLLRTPAQLGVVMLAVVLITLQGLGINRLAGLPYPLWAPEKTP